MLLAPGARGLATPARRVPEIRRGGDVKLGGRRAAGMAAAVRAHYSPGPELRRETEEDAAAALESDAVDAWDGDGACRWRGERRAAAACAAVVLAVAGVDPAHAAPYGSGLGYFEALERERAVSEEAVSNSARDERRANNPASSIMGMGGFGGRQQAPARGIPLSLGAGDAAGGDVEYTAGASKQTLPASSSTRVLNPRLLV